LKLPKSTALQQLAVTGDSLLQHASMSATSRILAPLQSKEEEEKSHGAEGMRSRDTSKLPSTGFLNYR